MDNKTERNIPNDKYDPESETVPPAERMPRDADEPAPEQDPSEREVKRDEDLVPEHDEDDGAHVVVEQQNIVAQDSIRDDLFGPTSVHPEDYTA